MNSGKVKCTCGWSWNKSDSSKKDMYICHECGRDNSNNMQNGGWLDSYANGGTMQEHQENYNDSSVSLPEGFVGMGNNTKGRNYSPAWGGQFQEGGEIPNAQSGRATRADSLAVYNNTKAIEDYYKKQGYVKERVKDSEEHKRAIKDRKESVKYAQKWLKETKNTPVDTFYTQTDKNKNIAEDTKHLKLVQKRLSEVNDKVDPKKYLKRLEESKISFEKRLKDSGRYVDEQNNLVEEKPSIEKFHLPVDENKFYQREQSAGFLDLRSPMPLYDKRIVPQYLSELKSPDLILQDQIQDKMHKARTIKERNAFAKQYADLIYTDNVEMYEYDPLAVMPFDMVPLEQQEERIRKYGSSGVPKSVLDLHPEWVNANTKPIANPTKRNVEGLQPMSVAGLQDVDNRFETNLDIPTPVQRIPKYYDITDTNNQYGGGATSYRVDSLDELRELPKELWDRKITPQYQMGGSVYPVNYVPKAQTGMSIPGSVGFTYARTQGIPSEGPYAKKTMPSAQNGIQTFYSNYLQSPKYKERLLKEGFSNPNSVISERLKNVSKSKIKYGSESYYDPTISTAFINQKDAKTYNTPISSIIAHELSHAAGALGRTDKFNPGNLGLSNFAINEINKRNNLSGYINDYIQGKVPLNIEKMHDSKPSEFKADMDVLRYRLFDDKIYDASKQDFNQDILNKAKQKYKGDKEVERLFQRANDKDLIWLMNNIAQNNNDDNILDIAQNGREMSYYQHGLDFTPKGMQNGGWLDAYGDDVPKAQTGKNIRVQNTDGSISVMNTDSPEYRKMYNTGQIQNAANTEDSTYWGGVLDEVPIMGKPREKGFWEQYADKIAEENRDAGLLGAIIGTPISAVTSLPQLAMTKGINNLPTLFGQQAWNDGKMQRPSEALDVQNPYGAFAVDLFTDPINYVGAGLADDALKLTSKGKNLLKKGFGKPVKVAEQNIVPIKDMFIQPTPLKASETLPKELEPYLSSYVKPISDEEEVFRMSMGPEYRAKKLAEDTVYLDPEGNIISSPKKTYTPFIEDEDIKYINAKKNKNINVVPEERSIIRSSSIIDINDVSPTKFNFIKQDLSEGNNIKYSFTNEQGNNIATFSGRKSPEGIYVNSIQVNPEFRRQGVASDIYKNIAKELQSKNEGTLFSRSVQHQFTDKDELGRSIAPANKLWENLVNKGEAEKFVEGMSHTYKINPLKQGGIIKDDRGQWAHPGEITEIGSNDITMEGVPYDVLGISDTGDTKLMKPGKNYKFKGKKVTEFPMAKNGLRQEQKGLVNLDQLTNFTNYNKPQPGGWLNKYN